MADNPFVVKATSGGGAVGEVPPVGSHAAVLVAVIDLGSHTETFKQKDGSEVDKTLRKVRLVWELPAVILAGSNKPAVIGSDYTLSMSNKSKLRPLLESWRGVKYKDDEEVDLTKLVGAACILSIVHKEVGEKSYAAIGGVSKLLQGMKPPKPTRQPFMWFIGCGEPIPKHDWLPWIYGESADKVIMRSIEWKAAQAGQPRQQPANGKPAATPPAKKPAPPPPEEEYQGSDVGEDADSIPF